jgi:glycosyltransferase involved in cell wall biosynthesis
MKIGLNAIVFEAGKMGGVETYFRNLVNHLQLQDSHHEFLLIDNGALGSDLPLSHPNFRSMKFPYAPSSLQGFVRNVLRNTIAVDPLERELDRLGLEVIHHPFTVLNPMNLATSSVLTFWDMQHEFHPEYFSAAERYFRAKNYRTSAQRATRIIASANFTKECLVERYGIPEGKIDVVYVGYGDECKVGEDKAILDEIRTKFGLKKPFLYYPAATWPHKNHRTLLAALKILKETAGFDGELVLTGIARQSHGELLGEIDRSGLSAVVRILGYLPVEDLPGLYNLAKMMIFPSLFEGFGIPLVEAMACGCPVVCSRATCLPEIVDGAGLMFDPASPEDMAEKIWSVWSNDARREELRRLGLERAKIFDWRETARMTIRLYEKAAETSR